MSISTEITRINTAVGNAYTAIQNKGGTLPVSQKVAGLADAIGTIPTGGGGATEEKTLNFYDCFGKLVASYANNEIQGLSALPTPTDYSQDEIPMTFQSWNWSLADIKSYNTSYPNVIINVGGTYVPTDGKTHLKFKIGEHDTNGVKFTITTTGGTVNWGDGTSGTISSTTLSHVYSSAGEYDCTLTDITSLVMYSSTAGDPKYYIKLIEARLGSSVTSIGNNAFSSCYSLTSITIPSGVTSIGEYAFQYCYSITSITIPSSVTSIGNNAFFSCYSLTSITIPSGVTSIVDGAFQYCYSITSITIPSGVTSIGNNAFKNCYSLTSITIPSGVTSIGNNAIQYCYSITSITIPSGVTSIGNNAFQYCYSITNITIPSSVTSIGNNAFSNCFSLTSITIPSGVTSIADSAFSNCFSLTSITIPSGVTSIGTYVFFNCYSLVEVIMEKTTPPTLSNTNAFNDTYLKHIYVPSSAVSTYKSASNWSSFSRKISANPYV